jgi:tetratricopeptide (TPR) repeat protein
MKKTLIPLLCLGIGLAGAIAYVKIKKSSTTATATMPSAERAVVAAPEPTEPAPVVAPPAPAAVELAPAPPPTPVASATPSNPESEAAAALRQTVDHLLAPQYPAQKQELMDRLRTSGQIDAAIADLQRRAKENPGDANVHTTLGEAMLNKVRLLHETGADINEQGILAMQADQTFNAALKIDPKNWEAQFVNYSTMFYWPAELQRDAEVAQKLSGLIDQQDALPSQPHFAQTYVVLGNQYLKMGKPDFAEATWRLGLTKFPNDPMLLAKTAAGK